MLTAWIGSMAFGPASLAVVMCFVWYILAGISQNAIVPVSFEYSLELTFPEPEAVTSGMLVFGANTVAFILLNVASTILGEEPTIERSETVMVVLLVMSVLGAGCSVFVNGSLLRFEMESAQSSPTTASVGVFNQERREKLDGISMTAFGSASKP